ncbi:MAG: 3-methyl-2-oxobutanoate hydroxymethyltransferase [Planctomycetaceae bacterium]
MNGVKRQITVPEFVGFKQQNHRISMLTSYDYITAKILDESGIEAILVGDTVGMVFQGHDTTLPVTLDDIIYHAEIVGRAVNHALVIVDLPFPTHLVGDQSAISSAGRILKETRCQAVKLEGGADQAGTIAALVSAGIPVMGHIGLRPQSVHTMGGYKVQRDEEALLSDALAVQQAGAFSVVLECVPADLADKITQALDIPTIGIGAGNQCDGQVLVLPDMLGLTPEPPRFVKKYADLHKTIADAATRYRDEVQSGKFPDSEHSYQ